MRALGQRTLRKKVENETRKYMEKEYGEALYYAVVAHAPGIMKQTEAMVLYALSLHGYGEKRLNDVHKWFTEVANMPASIMGKTPHAYDIVAHLESKYNINFTELSTNFPSYEQYKKQET